MLFPVEKKYNLLPGLIVYVLSLFSLIVISEK